MTLFGRVTIEMKSMVVMMKILSLVMKMRIQFLVAIRMIPFTGMRMLLVQMV